MQRKQNSASALGITMHFSEIIKHQFGKNAIHCFVFYGLLEKLLLNDLYKMRGYPQFSFGFQISLLRSAFPA